MHHPRTSTLDMMLVRSTNSVSRCLLSSQIIPSLRGYSSVNVTEQAERTKRVLDAKVQANLSYDSLASKLGVTNTYAAQLILGQAKLTPDIAAKLQAALPTLSDKDVQDMQSNFPMRTFNSEILKEPNVYRTYEAITHYGEAIKTIINEQCGDGIMSAIDFYCDVGTTTGKSGELLLPSMESFYLILYKRLRIIQQRALEIDECRDYIASQSLLE
jgi:cyanate lyase